MAMTTSQTVVPEHFRNPTESELVLFRALLYELSCVQSFYPNLVELRACLQELFILSVTAKPALSDDKELQNYAFVFFMVGNVLKIIEKIDK
jgi:hypothetical protein